MRKQVSWHATVGEFIQCPVPGCDHVGAIITKAHCRIAHEMTRDEVKSQYGYPITQRMKMGVTAE